MMENYLNDSDNHLCENCVDKSFHREESSNSFDSEIELKRFLDDSSEPDDKESAFVEYKNNFYSL